MGFTLWFTGLPGSGKKALAEMLRHRLDENGLKTELLDFDDFYSYYSGLFQLDTSGISMISRNMAVCAEHLNRNGIPVIAASALPMRKDREKIRSLISDFILVFCNSSKEAIIKSDPKEISIMSDKGLITDFSCPNGVYEHPFDADIEINTGDYDSFGCIDDLIIKLSRKSVIAWLQL